MHTEEDPREVAGRPAPLRCPHHDRGTTRAAVCASVGQEAPLSLESQAKRGGRNGLPHHGHMVECVVESKWKPDHKERTTDLHDIRIAQQMPWREGAIDNRARDSSALDFDNRNVDFPRRILALPPHAAAMSIERDREADRGSEIVGIDMKTYLDSIGIVLCRLRDQDMPASHEEQSIVPLKKEATRVRQASLSFKGTYLHC